MIADETSPEEFRYERDNNKSDVKDWGKDKDPKNDPTYPIKKRTDEEIRGYTWDRPPQQPVNIEVLRSVEHKNFPAVYGKTIPPSGLSGMIRRAAFKYSESSFGRWMPLVLADRINMVEGIFDDLKRGHFPNIFVERGLTAEWKYNKKEFLIKSAAALAVTAGVTAALLTRTRKNCRKDRVH